MCHQIDNIIANGNKMQSPAPTQAGAAATSADDRHAHGRIAISNSIVQQTLDLCIRCGGGRHR